MTAGILTEARAANFWKKVDKSAGDDQCWIWTGAKQGGRSGRYGAFQMGWKTQKRAHRLSYEMTYGSIPEGLMVCHSCDTPLCVNPAHLFLGDAKANVADMVSKGRHVRCVGNANGASRLNTEIVRRIYLDPRTNREIAADFQIEPSLVSQIRRRKIWAHATDDLPDQLPRKRGAGSPAYRLRLQALTR
jgi:hypothetical protein